MNIVHENPPVDWTGEHFLNGKRLELLRKRHSNILTKNVDRRGANTETPMAIKGDASDIMGNRFPKMGVFAPYTVPATSMLGPQGFIAQVVSC